MFAMGGFQQKNRNPQQIRMAEILMTKTNLP
jgi:hypothetical protein